MAQGAGDKTMIAKFASRVKDTIPLLDRETLRDLVAVASFLFPIVSGAFTALVHAGGPHA